MELKHECMMYDLLHQNLDKYVQSNTSKTFLQNINANVPIPNLYIRSNSFMSAWSFINVLICKLNNIPITNLYKKLVSAADEYMYNNYMFVFNINTCSLENIKGIVEQPSITLNRHCIIIICNEVLKNKAIYKSINSLINKYIDNAFFIFLNVNNSYISNVITHTFLYLHVKIDVKSLISDNFSEDIFNPIMELIDNDPLNLCILLDVKCLEPETKLEKYILKNLEKLTNEYRSSSVSYFTSLHNFCICLNSGCIPINKLATIILKYKSSCEIVSLLTEMDWTYKNINKTIFAIEHYLDKIIKE